MSRFGHGGATVVRLRPIRVLLVGRDRRFIRMANMLLSRQGYEVALSERPSELLDRVESERPNVVVLDASGSLSAAARAVAALEALPSPVAAVVVHEGEREDPLRNLRLVPKWGRFDGIVSEVERVYRDGGSSGGASQQALP